MTKQEHVLIVQATVRAFTSSFPTGHIQESFSVAADVAASLLATIVASCGLDMESASADFVRAIERCTRHAAPTAVRDN